MTTHVLIVDDRTFPLHLQYMFAGTGDGNRIINGIVPSTQKSMHWAIEAGLVSMIADGARVRKDDFIIFYLRQTKLHEGMFFGIFQAVEDSIFIDDNSDNQYLKSELGKSLTFRFLIKPFEVYADGVTEWEALDVIRNIQSPCQMLWSLIYRKLKGNRGNTMITIYEAERLFELIRAKNNHHSLQGIGFRYANKQICIAPTTEKYDGKWQMLDILPRLVYKYNHNNAHEAHLQAYIAHHIGKGTNPSLDEAIGITSLEWIGNEVSCGVGMQRIDLLLSQNISLIKREILPVELKCVYAESSTVFQLIRYVDWLEQYYIPNRPSHIQPVLICRKQNNYSKEVLCSFNEFDNLMQGRCIPLRFVVYSVIDNNILFERIR